MKILSLDASSTAIGIALLESGKTPKLLHLSYYKPPKKGNIFERLLQTKRFIFEMLEKLQPDQVAIEDIILFMGKKGKSTAKTITTLAIFNRTVGLAILEKTGKSPDLLNVMSIRHKIKLDKKLPAKEDIPELVAKILSIPFPYVYDKKGKMKKENNDMADAAAVGLAWLKINGK